MTKKRSLRFTGEDGGRYQKGSIKYNLSSIGSKSFFHATFLFPVLPRLYQRPVICIHITTASVVVDNGHDPEGRRTHASSARDCCFVGGRCSLLSCRIHCGILCRLRWLLTGIRWELGTIRWQRNLSCTTIGL